MITRSVYILDARPYFLSEESLKVGDWFINIDNHHYAEVESIIDNNKVLLITILN